MKDMHSIFDFSLVEPGKTDLFHINDSSILKNLDCKANRLKKFDIKQDYCQSKM